MKHQRERTRELRRRRQRRMKRLKARLREQMAAAETVRAERAVEKQKKRIKHASSTDEVEAEESA